MINLILISFLCGKVGFEENLVLQSIFSVNSQRLVQLNAYKPPNTLSETEEKSDKKLDQRRILIFEFLVAGGVSIGWDCFAWSVTLYHPSPIYMMCLVKLPGDILLTGPAAWSIGKLLGKNSSLWKAMIGAGIGNLLGVALFAFTPPVLGVSAFFLLPPLGAVIGCNL